MTLQEVTEPLFQYICRLNQIGRAGGVCDYDQVRSDVEALFEQMRAQSAADPRIAEQYRQVESPLTYFVDSMISESQLPFATTWHQHRLAAAAGERAGDEKFFDLLDEALEERGEGTAEKLAVYYTCLGLGFTGYLKDDPETLRKKMLRVAARARTSMDAGIGSKIVPEAYEHVDTRDLVQPPGKSLFAIGLALVGLTVTLLVITLYLFRWSSVELERTLQTIAERGGAQTVDGDTAADEER